MKPILRTVLNLSFIKSGLKITYIVVLLGIVAYI